MPDRFFVTPAPRATFGELAVYGGLALLLATAIIPLPTRVSRTPDFFAMSEMAHPGFCPAEAPKSVCAGLAAQLPVEPPVAALLMARMFRP